MSGGNSGRFAKGQSGNPAGRPKPRRPHISAFDIIFDKTLTVTQGGSARELTVDEALQMQTYQAALKGERMAVRAVLKMIEKREAALTKLNPPKAHGAKIEVEYSSNNADAALLILEIAVNGEVPSGGCESLKFATWASQLAISRPGRRSISSKSREDIERYTVDPDKLRWPRTRRS